jgi:hypothetical protein
MEILILTNSFDGTADIISQILAKKKIKFLRWNIDLWDNYEIIFNENKFQITDPLNITVSSNNSLKVLWRKPFTNYINIKPNRQISQSDLTFAGTEIKSVLHSIMSITRDNGRNFIDPIDEIKLPKLKQLKAAKKYFKILPYEFSINKSYLNIEDAIAKSLGTSAVGEKILYTTKVNQKDVIRPYPWFFQKMINKGKDITAVYIDEEVFFYYCEFKRGSNSIDWRVEINQKDQSKWFLLEHKSLNELKEKTKLLMKEFNLRYGRIDFIEENDIFYFLECNPNGQFGWLDDFNTLYLHNKFVDAFLKN